MRYVIAGNYQSFCIYLQNNKLTNKKDAIYIRKLESFNKITEDDIIVLLFSWWARSWAKKAIIDVKKIFPNIKFEYLDGRMGEIARKDLESEREISRFDLLDL